jgi:WD40 repeat protein
VHRLLAIVSCLVTLSACGKPAPGPDSPPTGAPTLTRCPDAPAAGPREAPTLLIQDGHAQPINTLALSGDGSLLASASLDRTLRIWDTRTGLMIERMTAPGATAGLAFDRAGRWLAFAHAEGEAKPHAVRVRRLSDDHQVELPRGPFALSRDGSRIVIGTSPIQIFDTSTGRSIRQLSGEVPGEVHGVALSDDGSLAAAGIAATVAVFDAETGALVRKAALDPEPMPPTTPPDAIPLYSAAAEVAFVAHDVVLTRGTRRRQLFDRQGQLRDLPVPKGQAVVIPGRLWATSSDNTIQSFALPQGTPGERYPVPKELFRFTASADGSTLALAELHPIEGYRIQVMDGASGHVVRTIEALHTSVQALAMSPDGTLLGVGSQAALTLWTLPRGEMWFSTPDRRLRATAAISFSHDGKQVASVEANEIRVREAATGRLLRAWRVSSLGIGLLTFVPGTSKLLTVDEGLAVTSGHIAAYDLSGPLPQPSDLDADNLIRDLRKPPVERIGTIDFGVEAAALSPDGSTIVAAADSYGALPSAGAIALLDARTGAERWRIESRSVGRSVGFSADGKRVLLSGRQFRPVETLRPGELTPAFLRAFSAATGELEQEVALETAGPIAARSDRIVIGGGQPVVLDAATLEPRAEVELGNATVWTAIAHPRQDAFLLGTIGGSTALVRSDGKLQALLVSTPGGDYVASTPRGAYRASLDGARRLAWTFRKPLEAFSFEQFAARLDRPDVVRQRLAGSAVAEIATVTRPPRLKLQSNPDRRAEGRTTTVRAAVASRRQVERVRVFNNGRLASDELVCASRAEVELTVPLQPGDNRLAVIAYDSDGFASNPRILDVTSTAAGRQPELWIVTIGVSRYPRLAERYQLQFADDDARAIAAALERLAGEGRRFSKAHVTTLTDEKVTVTSIERALSALSQMKSNDLAVVFLAGHGLRLEGGKMHFLTYRASLKRSEVASSAIGWDQLNRSLREAAGRVVMLLDACHSGHVTTEPVAPNEALAKALAADDRTGILVFAASRGSQLSYEVSGRDGASSRGLELAWQGGRAPRASAGLAPRHGLFTSALLEALAGQAPDRDQSGATEIGELIDFVTERVRAASNGQQTPWVARRELFGDFPLR